MASTKGVKGVAKDWTMTLEAAALAMQQAARYRLDTEEICNSLDEAVCIAEHEGHSKITETDMARGIAMVLDTRYRRYGSNHKPE